MRTLTAMIFAFTMTIASAPAKQIAMLPLQAGLAEVEITPPIGYRMDGYFTERPRTGIPAANIAVTATHTHTGRLFSGERARIFSDQAREKYGSDPLAGINYVENLRDRLVDVIVAANADLSPATLDFAAAREDRLSFNRRYHLNDGTVATNPGISNPKIVGPAGPIDPDLPFLLISKEKRPVGSVTVFAMHLDTVGGTEYSADYAGQLASALRRE